MDNIREAFYIQCEQCLTNETVHDSYNNENQITIKIVGECIVEISCKSCGNTITSIDGNIF